jgi:hypothetical protein
MKIVFEKSTDMATTQIVQTEDGKFLVRYESVLTAPRWDRAGINGPYWVNKGEFNSLEEAKQAFGL